MDYWEKNGLTKPQAIIVCAACRYGYLILCGARHWDRVMKDQYSLVKENRAYPSWSAFEQGFIDQFGTFYNREDAFQVVHQSGQPFNEKRNGSDVELFSEGLY